MVRFSLVLLCAAGSAWPQFDQALNEYRKGHLDQAGSLLEQVQEDKTLTAAISLRAQIALDKGQYRSSIAQTTRLLTAYQGSRFDETARLLRAQAYFALAHYDSCVTDLLWIRDFGKQKNVREESVSRLWSFLDTGIPYPHLLAISRNVTDADLRIAVARRLLLHGRSSEARTVLASIGNPGKAQAKRIRELQSQMADDATVKIVVITSLSGSMKALGREVLDGLMLAIRQYNERAGLAIELITFDDQSDIVTSIRKTQEAGEADDVSLIIGPNESNMMAAAASIAQHARIPIVSATATQPGLTDIGSYVFQANIPLVDRTERLAEFAVNNLGMKSFAILAPSDEWGDRTASRFAEIVERLGGRIVASERFYDNAVDFRTQFTQIRKRGLMDKIHGDRTRKISVRELDSLYQRYYPVDPGDKKGNEPALLLDGIFLPVYTENIKYIAPQMAFYNIQAKPLGEDSWYDLSELRLHQAYIKGAIVASEYHLEVNANTQKFQAAFKLAYGREPGHEAAYGYDLGCLVADLVRQGARTSDAMYDRLCKGIEWKGIHNTIRLSSQRRANDAIHILQFKDGHFSKLN